jgi:hypothetical protein
VESYGLFSGIIDFLNERLVKSMQTKRMNYGPNESLSEKVMVIPGLFSEKGMSSSFFTNDDWYKLSLTSKSLWVISSPELEERLKPIAQKLLSHVVLGQEAVARAMIEKNPKLLLIKSEAKDYQGRTIIATPFQAALGACDKPMWERMLPHLDALKPGEALKQFQEWFPEGFKEDEISTSALKAYYNELAQAIILNADGGNAAIERFREYISHHREIRQGEIFNLQHLIAAYAAYIDNFDALGTLPKLDLFWNQVMGYAQRQMSSYDAQVHCAGIQSVLNDPAKFKRSFKFLNSGEFLPLAVNSGLGFEFAVYSYYGGGKRLSVRWINACEGPLKSLQDYVEQKQAHWQDLENRLSQECLINLSNRF